MKLTDSGESGTYVQNVPVLMVARRCSPRVR